MSVLFGPEKIECLNQQEIELTIEVDGASMPFLSILMRAKSGKRSIRNWVYLTEEQTNELTRKLQSMQTQF